MSFHFPLLSGAKKLITKESQKAIKKESKYIIFSASFDTAAKHIDLLVAAKACIHISIHKTELIINIKPVSG